MLTVSAVLTRLANSRGIASGGALMLVIGSFCSAAPAVLANNDLQAWGAVVASGPLTWDGLGDTDAVRFWLEGQGRFNDDASRFNQGILRTAAGYRVSDRAVLWVGYAFIPNHIETGRDVVEHRIWQQLTWDPSYSLAGWHLASRSRLEQRSIEGVDSAGWRARQLFKVSRPLSADGSFYLALWDELFMNLNDTQMGPQAGLDQNRMFAGLGVRLSSEVRTEVGYLYQWVDGNRAPDEHNHMISVTVLLNF